MACSKLEKDITLTCCVVEKFFHEINKTKNIKMRQVFVANLSNSVRVQKLNFAYKRVSVKKFLYSGNFNPGKDFQHRQKVKVCLFICVN